MPTATVAVAYALLLASLVILVVYVHIAGQSLRVAGLIDLVGDNLHAEINRLFPVDHGRPGTSQTEDRPAANAIPSERRGPKPW